MTDRATGTATAEPDAPVLAFTRVFPAPRALVWKAWTEPEHFARWFGPHGSTVELCRMDVRPGGLLHFCHRFADYPDVWVRGVYAEVAAPERLVFTATFSDPDGSVVERPGFARETRIAVALAEVPGGTEVTIRHAGLASDQGEVQGWNEGLDRLRALLAGDPVR